MSDDSANSISKFLSKLFSSKPVSHQNKSKLEQNRDIAVDYLKRWLLTPYSWGADDFHSIDCSGLIMEVLKSVGMFADNEDLSADGLYDRFRKKGKLVASPGAGILVFFLNRKGEAKHVAMMINDRFMIHATGGGKACKTIADAIERNAFVKQRELDLEAEERRLRYSQGYDLVDPFRKAI